MARCWCRQSPRRAACPSRHALSPILVVNRTVAGSTAANRDVSECGYPDFGRPAIVFTNTAVIARAHTHRCHRPPPGLAFGEPDDRLLRAIQYSRDRSYMRIGRGVLGPPL